MTRDLSLSLYATPPTGLGYALVLHAGAGGRVEELSLEQERDYGGGLAAAYAAGEEVLAGGGSALDAVCATVSALEDNPLFNAGRGAALTATGRAELDSSIMTGDGCAGAIAASRYAKNPVRVARKVMEETDHVLLVGPSAEMVEAWGLETVAPEYFVTPARQEQLRNVQAKKLAASRHGTVGAVALDRAGRIVAGTSTGGMTNQADGRVGDTPIIGAGTFARDGVAGISCTGEGEYFIEGAVAHDIVSRMAYLRSGLSDAMTETIDAALTARDASGGIIGVDGNGVVVVGHNSPAMFAAYRHGDRVVTLV